MEETLTMVPPGRVQSVQPPAVTRRHNDDKATAATFSSSLHFAQSFISPVWLPSFL